MKPKTIGPTIPSNINVLNKVVKEQEVIQACVNALKRSQNFWLKQDVNEGRIAVKVEGNKIFLEGVTESWINRYSAYSCVAKVAKKSFKDMEIVSRIVLNNNYGVDKTSDSISFDNCSDDDDDIKRDNLNLKDYE